jgi:protein-disulfide isomerase
MSQVLYDRPALTVPIGDGDHVRGPRTTRVTLLEYGDYECPFCSAAHKVVHEVRAMLGDELRFAYRHFPLAQIHPHAFVAAEAAEAAGAQGKFWGMHDLLFRHQDRLGAEDLLEYARRLDLELPRFTRELASHTHAPTVRAHFSSGVRSGVNGTPTFFINGYRHNGGYDLPSLVEALRSEL